MSKLTDILKGATPSKIAGESIKGLMSGARDILDEVITNKEELAQAELRLKELEAKHSETLESQITERWKADSNSDSKAAKNIRPYSLASLLLFAYIMAFTDSTNVNFEVKPEWINLFKELLIIAFIAYFGGRSAEKIFRK